MASIRPLMPDCCDFAAKASEAGASLLGVVDMNEFLCGGARCGAPEYAAWIISLSRSVCSQEMFDTAIWERSGCIADRAGGVTRRWFLFPYCWRQAADRPMPADGTSGPVSRRVERPEQFGMAQVLLPLHFCRRDGRKRWRR